MSPNNNGFKNADSLTAWVRYMLFAQIIVAVVLMGFGYLEYEMLSERINGTYSSYEQLIADLAANDLRKGITGIIYVLIFVVSAFLILRWIHRVNYNAKQLGARDMKFSPLWSIGWFFIPILGLWKPYQSMSEIWKASKEPSDWRSQESGAILPLWWTLWLLMLLFGLATYRISIGSDLPRELMDVNIFTQIARTLDILLALAFLIIVTKISGFQTSHLANAHNQLERLKQATGSQKNAQ